MRCDDAQEKFVRDFVAAWTKVMNLIASTWPDLRLNSRRTTK